MKKMLLIVVLSLFAGLQVSVANSIRVEGYVYDSKDVGLNGVKVSSKDDYKNYETTTDNYQGDGFYYLKDLGIGTYTIDLVIGSLKLRVGGVIKMFPAGSLINLPEKSAQIFVQQGKIEPVFEPTDNLNERMAIMGEKELRT